jgi:hypothetical protein
MTPGIPVSQKLIAAALISMALAFAVGATPQGKGQDSGSGSKKTSGKQLPTTPDVPSASEKPNVSKKPTVSKKTSVSKNTSVSKKAGVSKKASVSKKPSFSKKTNVSKGPNVSKVPNVSGGGVGTHQSCVESCNTIHKNDAEICRGRTGPDRASCQRSINEQHRLCIQSCPK